MSARPSSAAARTSGCGSSSAAIELSGVVPGLCEPERAQRERAPPPQPAPQIAVGELEHRQRLCDRAGPGDSLRVAILDERLDQQPRERKPMSRGTGQQRASRRFVSLERALYERAIPLREAPVQRPLHAERRSLHDDGSGHRQRRRDGRPDHQRREARKFGQQTGHRNPCMTTTVSRSSRESFDRHWRSHVVATDVSDGRRNCTVAATVCAPRFPIRSAVRSSKLSMPYAYVTVVSTRRQARNVSRSSTEWSPEDSPVAWNDDQE